MSPSSGTGGPFARRSVEGMGRFHVYAVFAGEEPQRRHVRDPIKRGQTLCEPPAVPALAEVGIRGSCLWKSA